MANLGGALLGGAVAGGTIAIVIKAVDQFSGVFASVNKSMLAAGAGITALGIGGAVALKGLVDTATSFESAFTGVRKTVELTEAEFGELRNRLKDLSKETPITFEELSKIGEIAGQLGVEGVDNLEKFTKTIADISVTTSLTAEDAATSFARIANVMQLPLDEVDRMGAAIVDLGNNFATTEGEIAVFAQRVAGAGNIAGLTTQDILAIGAAMSSVGVQAEAGGTAVQKVLIEMNTAATATSKTIVDNTLKIENETFELGRLENQLQLAKLRQSEFTEATKESTRVASEFRIEELTEKIRMQKDIVESLTDAHGKLADEGGKKLKVFAETAGLTSEQFQKAWKDDAGAAFALFIKGLGEQGDEAINTLSNLGLEDQRLVRSFLSLANAGDLVTETFKVSNEAWEENTALVEEANKRYQTVESQVAILKNKFASLKDTLGQVLLPTFIKLVDVLGKVIGWFEKHPTLTKFAVVALAIGTALALVIGPLLILVALIPAFVAGLGLIAAGMGAVTIAGAPVWAVVLLIAAAVAILILWGILLVKNWDKIKEAASSLWDWLKGVWNTGVELAKSVTTKIANFYIGMANAIRGAWNAVVDAAASSLNWFVDKLNTLIKLVNRIPGVDIPRMGRVSLDFLKLADIPYLAKGGIVTGPTLAMLGENGPEMVVPLNRAQPGITVYINNLNGFNARDISQELQRELEVAIRLN